MSDVPRWVIVTVLVACIIAMIVWARGTDHHRGQDVGAVGTPSAVVRTLGG